MMADVEQAIAYVLRMEDEGMSGVITDTPGDHGGWTRFGLASKWHPELVRWGFYSSARTKGQALTLAYDTYRSTYARPLLLAELTSQDVANHLLSFAVNDGIERGVMLFQRAILELLPESIVVDACMGAETIAAASRCMPVSLLNALRLEQIQFHVDLKQPEFLLGWVRRDLA